jgi:hypothetical protein
MMVGDDMKRFYKFRMAPRNVRGNFLTWPKFITLMT